MSPPARPESLHRLEKLIAALKAKGILAEQELAQQQANTEKASPETGARMVARAWLDPEWRAFLLRDGTAAAEAFGITMAGAPPFGVLEDTATRHHLIVCTLCSCYPRAVLGYPPHWYKSMSYRARVVRDPRGVMAEWGTVLPAGMEVRVIDSTADYRWMVLPMRPAGTEGWSEDELTKLVTRDDLVGVTLPSLRAPVKQAA